MPTPRSGAQWWEFFRKKLREGRQGYVVVPLVEDSEQVQAASLDETYETLANGELEAFRLGLIHGRMTPAEKDAAMDALSQRRDPGAGRHVGGRGRRRRAQRHADDDRRRPALRPGAAAPASRPDQPRHVSRAIAALFADPQTDEARERLKAFVELDRRLSSWPRSISQLRGPGDLFGTRQHGLPPLRIADLARDAVDRGRGPPRRPRAGRTPIPACRSPSTRQLRRMALVRYGKSLDLGDVG